MVTNQTQKKAVDDAAQQVVSVATKAAKHVKSVADEAAEHVKDTADEARGHFNQDREDFAATEPEVARRNLVLKAINQLAATIESYVDTSSELVAVVSTEQGWRNRAVKAMIALAVIGFLAAASLVYFGTNISATTKSSNDISRKIEDCSNPEGECFKANEVAEVERMRANAEQSNRLVDDAVGRVNANTDQKIAELTAQLAERNTKPSTGTNTTLPRRTITPTTTAGRSTTPTTTSTNRAAPTTQPIPRAMPPTTVNVLCSLLGIGC